MDDDEKTPTGNPRGKAQVPGPPAIPREMRYVTANDESEARIKHNAQRLVEAMEMRVLERINLLGQDLQEQRRMLQGGPLSSPPNGDELGLMAQAGMMRALLLAVAFGVFLALVLLVVLCVRK